jgi:hypothetical protein
MLHYEALELAHELAVDACSEVTLDPLLEGCEPEFFQPADRVLRPPLVGEVGERVAPPELERFAQPVLAAQTFEGRDVQLALVDPDAIARPLPEQAICSEDPPQPENVDVEVVGRSRRGLVAPKRLDQDVFGNRLVRLEKQYPEQGALLASADRDLSIAVANLQGAQDPELHSVVRTTLLRAFQRGLARMGQMCKRAATAEKPVCATRGATQCIPSRKEQTMNRLRLLAALAGALIAGLMVATIAAAQSDEGPGTKRNYSFGVGNFGPGCWQTEGGPFCVPFDYTMRLLGVGRETSGRAWGEFERRNNPNGRSFSGRVTCMTVDGNRAAIGGFLTITASPQPGFEVGNPFVIYVEDNGTLGTSTPDQISALAVFAPEEALPVARFPWVCPPADSTLGYLPLTSGDITVSEDAVGDGSD